MRCGSRAESRAFEPSPRVRSAGRVEEGPELTLLFHGLEGLERMVGAVRDGETPVAEPGLIAMLALPADAPASGDDEAGGTPSKKART